MNCFVGTEKTSMRERQWGGPDQSNELPGLGLTVQFLQGQLLGFSDKTEDHEPGDEVEPSIETDYGRWSANRTRRRIQQKFTYKLQLES